MANIIKNIEKVPKPAVVKDIVGSDADPEEHFVMLE